MINFTRYYGYLRQKDDFINEFTVNNSQILNELDDLLKSNDFVLDYTKEVNQFLATILLDFIQQMIFQKQNISAYFVYALLAVLTGHLLQVHFVFFNSPSLTFIFQLTRMFRRMN